MALYDQIGRGYAGFRRPDPRIAAQIIGALGDARSVVNVGAGAGSYEPPGLAVTAVEPSEVMIRQRPPGAAPCVQGTADALPLNSGSVDAAMAVLTIHHWPSAELGLREMLRVARRRIVLLTWVPDAQGAEPFWLTSDYFPQIRAHDHTIFPSADRFATMLTPHLGAGGSIRMSPVPIPHDCVDGFLYAYWRRPECYLEPDRRAAISSFARFDAEPGLARLREDLRSGAWAKRNRHILDLDALDVGYRLVTVELGTTRTGP